MKITIEPHTGGKLSAETEAEHISDVVELFKGLLVGAGYHPSTVDEYFDLECNWFTDREEDNDTMDQLIEEVKKREPEVEGWSEGWTGLV